MTIEIVIGAVIVIAVVAYIIMKDSKEPEAPLVVPEATAVEEAPKVEEKAEPAPKAVKAKAPAKKTATKKAEAVDLDSMNKTQLLAEAKKRGVKANASLKKDEILERIKNG